MNNRFIIIGRSSCPFCLKAIEYCNAKKVKHVFLNYKNKPEILQDYKSFHNHKTVPIILANNLETGYTTMVGGYSQLLEFL
jgi:glutaredoxin